MPASRLPLSAAEDESSSRHSWRHDHPAEPQPAAPFGTVLGVTDGGVEVCSCDYESCDKAKYPGREAFVAELNGTYTGYKYQCVELARRYLVVNHGVTFESIPMAFDIFNLTHVQRVDDGAHLPWHAHRNGARHAPVKGSLLIWEAHGEFKVTGHVAVVVAVAADHVDIVEQNASDAVWPTGVTYSRRLPVSVDAEGSFTIRCTYPDTVVLGWMNLEGQPTL